MKNIYSHFAYNIICLTNNCKFFSNNLKTKNHKYFHYRNILSVLFFAILSTSGFSNNELKVVPATGCNDLFISEYVEGTSNNKAIEIFNPTSSTITLTGNYQLKFYFNGSLTAGTTISLVGSVAPNDVFVIVSNSASATLLALADQTSTASFFNGDDAIELYKNITYTTLDVIGQIGFDPGTEWGSGLTSTADNTIRRKFIINSGDPVGNDVFNPAIEWDGFVTDDFSDLGIHYSALCTCIPTEIAPLNVTITNSECQEECVIGGGIINSPEGTQCPEFYSLQYQVNGQEWSSTLPLYDQDGPPQTIKTRCSCDNNPEITSPESEPVTTAPGECYYPQSPEIEITDNICPSAEGSIDSEGCGEGTVLEWAVNEEGPWSEITPEYTNYSFTVYARCRNIGNNCISEVVNETTSPEICMTPDPEISNEGGPTISDPCTCAGNGQFDEEVVISSVTGEIWEVYTNTNYLDPMTLIPFVNGTVFNENPAGSGQYTLVGKHLDDLGYSLTVTNGTDTLTISNECWYPDPLISGLDDDYCSNEPSVILAGSAQLGDGSGPAPLESESFSIDGNPSAIFDPALLGPGNYEVIYEFNAQDDNPDAHHPGCIAFDTLQVIVIPAPVINAASNSPVCEGGILNLFENGGNATAWIWTGPDNFSSIVQNPVISNVSEAAEGKYFVTGTIDQFGCYATDSVEVAVSDAPGIPIVHNISVCEGGSTLIVPESSTGGGGGGTCTASEDMVITGIIDGPLTGGIPKAVEFYVINDIPDLSLYGFGSANNGGGTDGQEFTFPAVPASSGTYLWVATESTAFTQFFGFPPTYINANAPNVNGDDAIELFFNGSVIDVFGNINQSGTGQSWEYMDGWVYRINNTGNDGNTFVPANWIYSGINAVDGFATNSEMPDPMPVGTYVCSLANIIPLFNFYSDQAMSNLLAGPAVSYDPHTTPLNSPQTIWVTEINTLAGCESEPVPVIITVYNLPVAEAGNNQFYCGLPASISLNATSNSIGIWTTTGAGMIAVPGSNNTSYNTNPADIGKTIIFKWTTFAPANSGCDNAVDSFGLTTVPVTPDAEFSYTLDEYCPGSSNPTVTHTTGVDGIYSYDVISGGPQLIIDRKTGEIDINTSDEGTYNITNNVDGRGNLIITGVIDGPITGGLPKAIELLALKDIYDLSRYGIESANNGNGSTGAEYTFPSQFVAAGTYIWVASETVQFNNFFGVPPTFVNAVASINGDDAIVLYNDGQRIDVFGNVNLSGIGQPWEYTDGWAYRKNNTVQDGTVFNLNNWIFSGPDALDNETSNSTAAEPWPIASFSTTLPGGCNNNSHSETIIIGDSQDPVVICPQDLIITLGPGECSKIVSYEDPVATDNCFGDLVINKISGPDKWTELTLLGSPYTVEYEVYDAHGNGPVYCSFQISINGYPNPVGVLVCNDEVQISLDQNCKIEMRADMFLEGGPYKCYNQFDIYVNDPAYNGINISNEKINLLPGTYIVTVRDAAANNNFCNTTMVVKDKIFPVLECNCPPGGAYPKNSEWVGEIKGQFTNKDLTVNIFNTCYDFGTEGILPEFGQHYFDVYPVYVSSTGYYDLIAFDDNDKAVIGVYETFFNPADVCQNLVIGGGGYKNGLALYFEQPVLNVLLQAGKKYYIVVSDFEESYSGKYSVIFNSLNGGHVYFAEGIYSEECIITACYDSDVNYNFPVPKAKDNCDVDVELIDTEVLDGLNCGTQILVNTWQCTDIGGNVASCTQEYVFQGFDYVNLKWPKNFDNLPFNQKMLECDSGFPVDEGGNPHPSFTGYPEGIGSSCGFVEVFYYDDVYKLDCGIKILRNWIVVDDCRGQVYKNIQIIRITDSKAPTFMITNPFKVNTKAFICNANVDVPDIMHLEDNCCDNSKWWITTKNNFAISGDLNGNGYVDPNEKWQLQNVPTGKYELCYNVVDCCGNFSSDCVEFEVYDANPPIAVCEQYKQVSLTVSADARVDAIDFNSGSFDNCRPVFFKVLRVNDKFEYDGGCPGLNGDDKPSTEIVDVWYDDQVYFCCDDAGKQVMVSLRVFDVNPGSGPIDPKRYLFGGDLYGHFNDCWSIVTIECKIPPALTCPPVEITCEESLDPNDNPKLWPQVTGICGVNLSYTDSRDNNVCSANITRTWTASSCTRSTQCKQSIKVIQTTPFDPCTIVFPGDKQVHCTNSLPEGGSPTWDEYPCNIITSEIIREDTFKFVEGACYKILREWAVIDWCVYKANTGAEDNIDQITGARKLNCNTLIKDGYYRYTQVLKIVDLIPPAITTVDQCVGFTDGCFANGVTMTAVASDTCNTNEEYWWKYVVINMDTWDTIQYSYNFLPKPLTGEKGLRSKDKLDKTKEGKLVLNNPVPGGIYKVIWTVGDGCGNANTAEQVFTVVDKKAPTPILVNISTATMYDCFVEVCAIIFDKGGCDGNCISSFDNCTPSMELYFTFGPVLPKLYVDPVKWENQYNKYGRYFYDPVTGLISTEEKYLFGEAYAWDPIRRTTCRVFGIDRLGNGPDHTQILEVYVWDKFALNEDCDDNNYDFGVVILSLNTDGDDCPEPGSLVSGIVKTCNSESAIKNALISFNDNEETRVAMSSEDGKFDISLPENNYVITATRKIDGIPGLTTLDLVIIQKHILGMKTINDICKMAAMDINSDGKVSATDILYGRKMLLGYLEARSNYNFLSDNFILENNANPDISLKDAYKMNIEVEKGKKNDYVDFSGVIAGDVNYSAGTIENRNRDVVNIVIDELELIKGETYEIPVYLSNTDNISGAQFELRFSGLEIGNISSKYIDITSSNYRVSGNSLKFSWNSSSDLSLINEEPFMIISVTANENGHLANSLELNNSDLLAELYKEGEISKLALKFRNIVGSFALHQNIPNPFSDKTVIGFDLPVDNEFTLSVFDITGKAIKEISSSGKAGYNSVSISKNEIGGSGVYYYRLKSGDNTDTRKMILIE